MEKDLTLENQETQEIQDIQEFQDSSDEENHSECMICKRDKVEYMCFPCRCKILCKKCAMKMASGGKCRKCTKLFVQCKRIL